MMSGKLTIGILGLGQIGGSIAARLSLNSDANSIIGFDLRRELLEASLQRHIVGRIARSELELIELSDVVIIALPIAEIIALLKRQQAMLRPKLAVMDTGSVKQEIMATAAELQLLNFIGGHPLAGTEKRGEASWNRDLFESATFFLSDHSRTDPIAIKTVKELVLSLGSIPTKIEWERHDHLFAITSGLSHLVAYALKQNVANSANVADSTGLLKSPSFLSATRVADSDPEMVFQMLWYNRQHLAGGLASLIEQLQRAKCTLAKNDPSSLRRIITLQHSSPKPD